MLNELKIRDPCPRDFPVVITGTVLRGVHENWWNKRKNFLYATVQIKSGKKFSTPTVATGQNWNGRAWRKESHE